MIVPIPPSPAALAAWLAEDEALLALANLRIEVQRARIAALTAENAALRLVLALAETVH